MPIISTVTLEDLPAPPVDKTGWPWTEQTEPLPKRMPDGSEYPRISIVTPSYNQGEFIEETIRSVLLQGYPNLEYIIIDGGSTDNSVEVIKKYEPWLTYWVSQPDRGQTDAIQQGFNRITGVVWNWLNSDDLLEPNALQRIANAYHSNNSATVYAGELTVFGEGFSYLHPKCFQDLSELACVWERWSTPQAAMYLSSNACHQVNGLNILLNFAMDYDLYLRLALLPNFNVQTINESIVRFRLHSLCKTSNQSLACKGEILKIFDDFAKKHPLLLPQGWQKSRRKSAYHFALDSARNRETGELLFFDLLYFSTKYISIAWNYRFFWSLMFSYFLPTKTIKSRIKALISFVRFAPV
jgi:glycosyltransferase involved in cell wall biosynthesis